MPLGPPLRQEQPQPPARAQKSELRRRTDLMKDRDASPSGESSLGLPGSRSGAGRGAGSSWGWASGDRRGAGEPGAPPHPRLPLTQLDGPWERGPRCREVSAEPINVNIHLGFRQRPSFPRRPWAPVRTTPCHTESARSSVVVREGAGRRLSGRGHQASSLGSASQLPGLQCRRWRAPPGGQGARGWTFWSEPASQTRAGQGSAALPA